MNKKEFESIIKKAPYHIFIFSTKSSFPINFAVHTYIVTVTPKSTDHRDIHRKQFKDAKQQEGHLHINYQKPWEGRYRYFWSRKSQFQSKLLFHLEGDQKACPDVSVSRVEKIIARIKNQIKKYPYKNSYHFLGINSNSFIQWIINQNPELKVKLPWNAFGRKNFTPN